MKENNLKRVRWIIPSVFLAVVLFVLAYVIYDNGRPAPIPHKETLFNGAVTYHRRVYYLPHLTIAHVLEIDTKTPGLRILVTPPDNDEGPPLIARTTSEFLSEYGVQIAINGDGFYPWWSRGPLDYYPKPGDPVTPNGFAASNKNIYASDDGLGPILYISRRNGLGFRKPGNVYNAISGDRYLIQGGQKESNLDDREREPRSAIGFNKNGRWLYLVVVDGRQPFYSSGASLDELAKILLSHGAYFAMSMDGGGSSTLVVEDESGQPRILNSPVDQLVPGRERPVANHIGIFVGK